MAKDAAKKAKEKAKGVAGEFKAFITRGNVLDMAVGVIVGTAFTKIVNSLVSDIIMPAIGMLTGNVSFSDMKLVLAEAITEVGADGELVTIKEAVTLNYGTFIDTIISFLLIALSVFVMVKTVGALARKRKAEEEAAPAPEPEKVDPQIELLTEIRDMMKEQQGKKE